MLLLHCILKCAKIEAQKNSERTFQAQNPIFIIKPQREELFEDLPPSYSEVISNNTNEF